MPFTQSNDILSKDKNMNNSNFIENSEHSINDSQLSLYPEIQNFENDILYPDSGIDNLEYLNSNNSMLNTSSEINESSEIYHGLYASLNDSLVSDLMESDQSKNTLNINEINIAQESYISKESNESNIPNESKEANDFSEVNVDSKVNISHEINQVNEIIEDLEKNVDELEQNTIQNEDYQISLDSTIESENQNDTPIESDSQNLSSESIKIYNTKFSCIVCYRTKLNEDASYLSEYCKYHPKTKSGKNYKVCKDCLKSYIISIIKQPTDRIPCLYGSSCGCHGSYYTDLPRIFQGDVINLQRCQDILVKRKLKNQDEFIECSNPKCDYGELISSCSSVMLLNPIELNKSSKSDVNSIQVPQYNAIEVNYTPKSPITCSSDIDNSMIDNNQIEENLYAYSNKTENSQPTTLLGRINPSNPYYAPDVVWHCRHCGENTCLKHRIPVHKGETCQQFDNKSKESEEKTMKWIENNTRKCPNCGMIIEKRGGCAEMTCRCERRFQWNDLSSIPYMIGIPTLVGILACLGLCTCCFCCCCCCKVNGDLDPRANEDFRRWV